MSIAEIVYQYLDNNGEVWPKPFYTPKAFYRAWHTGILQTEMLSYIWTYFRSNFVLSNREMKDV